MHHGRTHRARPAEVRNRIRGPPIDEYEARGGFSKVTGNGDDPVAWGSGSWKRRRGREDPKEVAQGRGKVRIVEEGWTEKPAEEEEAAFAEGSLEDDR